jgi:hypothetical protein
MLNRISQLSNRALDLAAALPTPEAEGIARWLYQYGCLPRGASIELNFGPGDDPMAVLGLTRGGVARRKLEASYEATTYQGWLSFALVSTPIMVQAACKLYVSPQPETLAMAFPVIADTFAEMEVRSFKVGRGIEGLLRPDKIVAYFDNRSVLDEVADSLCKKLKGYRAQGVPFTTELGLDGLLSWGIDPPPGQQALSWRSWITKQLAKEIVKVRPLSGSVAVAAALSGVSALGVDTARWMIDGWAFSERVES